MMNEDFIISIGADSSKFESEVKKVKRTVDEMTGTISIGFDTGQADEALKESTKAMNDYKGSARKAGRTTNELGKHFNKLQKNIKGSGNGYNKLSKGLNQSPKARASRQYLKGMAPAFGTKVFAKGTSRVAAALNKPRLAAQQRAKINPKPQDITPGEALARFQGMSRIKTFSSVSESMFKSPAKRVAKGNILGKVYINAKMALAKYNRELEIVNKNIDKLNSEKQVSWFNKVADREEKGTLENKKAYLEERKKLLEQENAENKMFSLAGQGPEAINTEISDLQSKIADTTAARKEVEKDSAEYKKLTQELRQYKRELFEVQSLKAHNGSAYEVATAGGARGTGKIVQTSKYQENQKEIDGIDKELVDVNNAIDMINKKMKVFSEVAKGIRKEIRAIVHDLQQDPDKKAWKSDTLKQYTREWQIMQERFGGDIPGSKFLNAFQRIGRRIKTQTTNIFANWLNPIYVAGRMINAFMSQNVKYANTFKVVSYNAVRIIEPLVKNLLDWVLRLLQYVNVFTKKWMNVDLFDKSYMSAKKTTEELKNITASFDELHPIGENDTTLMDTGELPTVDPEWIKKLEGWADKLKPTATKIGEWIADAFSHPIRTLFATIIALEFANAVKQIIITAIAKWLAGKFALGGAGLGAAGLGGTLLKGAALIGGTALSAQGLYNSYKLGSKWDQMDEKERHSTVGKSMGFGTIGGALLGGLIGGLPGAAIGAGLGAAITGGIDSAIADYNGDSAVASITAGLGGAGLGAAIGTVIGGPLGTAVGAAIGGAVGLVAEDIGHYFAADGGAFSNLKISTEDLKWATEQATVAIQNEHAALYNLKLIEEQTGINAKELYDAVQSGAISYDNLTSSQMLAVDAYAAYIKASEDAKIATKTMTDYKLAQEFQNAKTTDSYGTLVQAMIKAKDDGIYTEQELTDRLSQLYAELDDNSREVFLNSIPESMREGVKTGAYDYMSGWDKFKVNMSKKFDEFKTKATDAFSKIKKAAAETWERVQNLLRFKGFKTNAEINGEGEVSVDVESYDVGTNYVPNDQLALVHKGEAIVPAKYNQGRAYTPGYSAQDNSGLQSVMQMLVDTTDRLNSILNSGIPVTGEFRQRGSDLYATVERAKSSRGINGLSDVSFAR